MAENEKLLDIRDLRVVFDTYMGQVKAVRGVNLSIARGEVLALVGESGCGKSVTAQTVLQLNPSPPSRIEGGSVIFDGSVISEYDDRRMRSIRGKEISMIFQDPMTSLNPTKKIGRQITETILKHQSITKAQAKERAVEMLRLVGIPNPEGRVEQFPHQFSGGMRQRAMIAIALACNPKLLIADEPTTALDVTIQAQIIDLMAELRDKTGTAILLITHDLGVVADIADNVAIMYGGVIVEQGSLNEIFYNPQHPYTWGLLKSVPKIGSAGRERLIPIDGAPPDLLNPPEGCPFAQRCDYAMHICDSEYPPEFDIAKGHFSRCWLLHEMAGAKA